MNQPCPSRTCCAPRSAIQLSAAATITDPASSHGMTATRHGTQMLDRGIVGGNAWLASQLYPGSQIGEYRLVEFLGSGAQATVWHARHVARPEHPVALKLLLPSPPIEARQTARFVREAQRGMRSISPGMLRVEAHGSWKGILYMAMPLVRGCTLRQVIRGRIDRMGPGRWTHPLIATDPAEYRRGILKRLVAVVETLHAVHQAKIVHRDIKPDNILLDSHDPSRTYLSDFGLSRDLDVATPQQLCDGAGTPLYMAPEKLRHDLADEVRCDIYAMGCTIYEALALRPLIRVPRHMSQPAMLAYLVRQARSRRALRASAACPAPLAHVLSRATSAEPEERQATAHELATELQIATETRHKRGAVSRRSLPASAARPSVVGMPHAMHARP